MYESTLILLAGGGSRQRIDDTVLPAHPYARIWTLNLVRHPRTELQFEIHSPKPINKILDDLPAIVASDYPGDTLPVVDGPEVAGCPQPAPRIRFPLAAASALGAPFYELSHDYMLAYAALIHTGRVPDEAMVPGLSMRPFEHIILCGVDCTDGHHFARSRGMHFWIGLLRGLGVEISVMPQSTVLAGGIEQDATMPAKMRRPFCYGQPIQTTDGRRQTTALTSDPSSVLCPPSSAI